MGDAFPFRVDLRLVSVLCY